MNIKYIDIHSHLDFADYGADQKNIIQKMKDLGIFTIAIGTGVKSSKEVVKLAEENINVYACIGNHPDDELRENFDEKDYEELVKNPKVVAIGECGLDYFVDPKLKVESGKSKVISEEKKERQKKEFIKQIEFAIKYDKPLMLHIRDERKPSENSEVSAYYDAYEILKEYDLPAQAGGKVKGNMHFFAGSLEWAKKFIDLGFTISFTGVITFARQYDEVIKNIPLDKIHAETDAPFVAPIPFRGKRNEPTYVIEVVKKIAEIRGENLETVRLQLLDNAKKTFNLKF